LKKSIKYDGKQTKKKAGLILIKHDAGNNVKDVSIYGKKYPLIARD
jgi:hypothetical protein